MTLSFERDHVQYLAIGLLARPGHDGEGGRPSCVGLSVSAIGRPISGTAPCARFIAFRCQQWCRIRRRRRDQNDADEDRDPRAVLMDLLSRSRTNGRRRRCRGPVVVTGPDAFRLRRRRVCRFPPSSPLGRRVFSRPRLTRVSPTSDLTAVGHRADQSARQRVRGAHRLRPVGLPYVLEVACRSPKPGVATPRPDLS